MQNQQVLSCSTHPGRLGFKVGLREPARIKRSSTFSSPETVSLPTFKIVSNPPKLLQSRVELAAKSCSTDREQPGNDPILCDGNDPILCDFDVVWNQPI